MHHPNLAQRLVKQISNKTILSVGILRVPASSIPANSCTAFPPTPSWTPPSGAVHCLPVPLNLKELGSMMCNNSTGFNQQDSSDTLSTEIDELALNFTAFTSFLIFLMWRFFYCHLKDENLVNWMQCWLAQYYNCASWTPTACMVQLSKFPLYY